MSDKSTATVTVSDAVISAAPANTGVIPAVKAKKVKAPKPPKAPKIEKPKNLLVLMLDGVEVGSRLVLKGKPPFGITKEGQRWLLPVVAAVPEKQKTLWTEVSVTEGQSFFYRNSKVPVVKKAAPVAVVDAPVAPVAEVAEVEQAELAAV